MNNSQGEPMNMKNSSFMVDVRGWDGSGLEYLMGTKEDLLIFKVNAPGISFMGSGLPCNI